MSPADNSGDESGEEALKQRLDEYGEPFEDYGFFKRAEEKKEAGNRHFKKGGFAKALEEYDAALQDCLVLSGDPSVVLGKLKWRDVVVFRSTLQLNKSTCRLKMKEYEEANALALECLVGNSREQQMLSDPQIRQRVQEAAKETASLGECLVENKLPRALRAKAWFRISRCNTELGFLDRAREALAKALEMADDLALQQEISQQGTHIGDLERKEHARQKGQFKGFFDKLQAQGGYADLSVGVDDTGAQRVEELDDAEAVGATDAAPAEPA